MTKQSKNTLRNWFKNGAFPDQFHFWDWMDSFFHKDEPIPASQIDQLQDLLDAKLDRKDLPGGEMAMNDVYGLNAALDAKVDKEDGKGLSAEDFSSELKTKLDGVEEGANKYEHPLTHSADMIEETGDKVFTSEAEKLANANHIANADLHKTSEQIRSEIVDADLPISIARQDDVTSSANSVIDTIRDGADEAYNTLKKVYDWIFVHDGNTEVHKTSEQIRSEIVDKDIPESIARIADVNLQSVTKTGACTDQAVVITGGIRTTDSESEFFGFEAGNTLTTGKRNTLLGHSSGKEITEGDDNTAVGLRSGRQTRKGSRNTSIGAYAAGSQNTLPDSFDINDNTYVGYRSGFFNTSRDKNTAVGAKSLGNSVDTDSSVAIGYGAGYGNGFVSSLNTFIGYNSSCGIDASITNSTSVGANSTVDSNNQIVLGDSNIIEVKSAGSFNTPAASPLGSAPTGTNATSGHVLTADGAGGSSWTDIPKTDLASEVTGILSVANGGTGSSIRSFVDLTSTEIIAGNKTFARDINTNRTYEIGGTQILAFGNEATTLVVGDAEPGRDAANNVIVGVSAGKSRYKNITGNNNVIVGYRALTMGSGSSNVAIGNLAQSQNTGSDNIAIGPYSMLYVGTGNKNIGIGNFTLARAKGVKNIAIGRKSLSKLGSTGNSNVSLGDYSGNNITSGNSNVFIGEYAGTFFGPNEFNNSYLSNSVESIFIGKRARPAAPNETNQIVIANDHYGHGSNTATWGNNDITDHYFAGKIKIDEDISIHKDASNNLVLTDSVTGSKTLSELVNTAFITLDTYQEITGPKAFISNSTSSSTMVISNSAGDGGGKPQILLRSESTAYGSASVGVFEGIMTGVNQSTISIIPNPSSSRFDFDGPNNRLTISGTFNSSNASPLASSPGGTNVASGLVLTSDGSGGSSWQQSSGGAQTLQEVTDVGNSTTNNIVTTGTATASNFILSSDERLKTFKDESVVDVSSVDIKKFNYKDDETQRDRYGVSAQELQKVAPEMVYEDEDGLLSVGYTDFLLAKVNKQDQEITELKVLVYTLMEDK